MLFYVCGATLCACLCVLRPHDAPLLRPGEDEELSYACDSFIFFVAMDIAFLIIVQFLLSLRSYKKARSVFSPNRFGYKESDESFPRLPILIPQTDTRWYHNRLLQSCLYSGELTSPNRSRDGSLRVPLNQTTQDGCLEGQPAFLMSGF